MDGSFLYCALRDLFVNWWESLFPRRDSCVFCGCYRKGSRLSAGICPQCLLSWQRLWQQGQVCPRCGSFTWGRPCQGPCAQGLPGLRHISAAVPYTGVYRQLLFSFKYNGQRQLALPFGHLMALSLMGNSRLIGKIDGQFGQKPILVPVPLFPEKEKQRGFNQSRLLAQAVGRELGWPVQELLCRRAAGKVQAGLTKKERQQALDQVFDLQENVAAADLRHRQVIIVDDVITTGATLLTCCQLLQSAGAWWVQGLTFAGGSNRVSENMRNQ